MTFWPRFKLTPGEEKAGVSKYFDHARGSRGVLRKVYFGHLALTDTERQPVFNFQIARRCRVFAMTASGDLGQFRIQLSDSSGEQYLATPCTLPSLLGGYVELPPPAYGTSTVGATGGYPPNVDDAAAGNVLGWAYAMGQPKTSAPLVFEPNIVLKSNQVLQIQGSAMTDYANVDYRVDMAFHVWEFPSWNGGPA